MSTKRKEKLNRRGWAYANSVHRYRTAEESFRVDNAFQDGYRAAMRDARKALAAATDCEGANLDAIVEFLRPLR